jgi:hypothetical protein
MASLNAPRTIVGFPLKFVISPSTYFTLTSQYSSVIHIQITTAHYILSPVINRQGLYIFAEDHVTEYWKAIYPENWLYAYSSYCLCANDKLRLARKGEREYRSSFFKLGHFETEDYLHRISILRGHTAL